ncbi:hypothetical protein Tco_1527555, partial [Tanacetum coccineum]
TDNAKITRKRSKPSKHGHGNGKSTQEPEKECHAGNPCDHIFDVTAKTGYPMIEKIQGQRSNLRGACEEDLEASSPAINRRLLSLTKKHLGVVLI